MAAADAVVNFGVSNVATVPTPAASGTSLVVGAGHGVRFPAVPFNVTIAPATGQPTGLTAEIVRVTALSVDTLTIVRAQEGTTARTILVGDYIAATITKRTLDDRISFDQFDGLLLPAEIGTPTAPAVGVRLSVGRIAQRSWLQWMRPQGIPSFVSPHLAFNRVGVVLPSGQGGATVNALGVASPSIVGTATGRTFATTSPYTRRKRVGYVSVTTAAANVSARTAPNMSLGVGASSNVGGFLVITRFSISDAAAVTGARMFVGLSPSIAAPVGAVAEPSTVVNQIGVGHGSADTNLFMYFGGTTAQTPINLGVNFPTTTLSADMYELILHAPAESTVCHWVVNRFSSTTSNLPTFTASGSLANATPGTTLPATTVGLCSLYAWRTNNATALAVSLDLNAHYFETDGA